MRHLDWEGCWNVRDLGGLPTANGSRTRWGALVRGDSVGRLSADGWAALHEHGVRTIVDLRNDDERTADLAARPPGVACVHVALDGLEDAEFWEQWGTGPQFGTPLYYGPFLERFPNRVAAAVRAVAGAEPGGVLVHCVGGRDRTGLMTLLLLALAGVSAEEIAADYALSAERLRDVDAYGPVLEAYLAERGTSAREIIVSLLAELDVEAYLRSAGVGDTELAALVDRLVEAR